MFYSILNDGLNDEILIDEYGLPVEMSSSERDEILEQEYEERLASFVAENRKFLELGGSL